MSNKVLLAAPHNYGLYKLIIKNLEFLGYEVVHFEDKLENFTYNSLGERLSNVLRKVLFNDKSYKEGLRKQYVFNKQLDILDNTDYYEFVLVIRADFFEPIILEKLRNKTDKMISFHFDGISKGLRVLETVKYFDQFYVFDKDDVSTYSSCNFLFSSNFYFDFPEDYLSSIVENPDVYYVSSYEESRVQPLIKLHQELSNIYNDVRFILVHKKEEINSLPNYIKNNIEIVFHYVSFEDQLKHISNSKVIIDLVISSHNGLSFRIFEGLKYKKKVITTNKTILDADFYHPNNYFFLNEDNYSEIANFLQLPYVNLGKNIVEKYSFTSWINDKIKNE